MRAGNGLCVVAALALVVMPTMWPSLPCGCPYAMWPSLSHTAVPATWPSLPCSAGQWLRAWGTGFGDDPV